MEKQLFNMHATPLVTAWANAFLNKDMKAKEMHSSERHGIVTSWRLGDRKNGVWFFFLDDTGEENSAYRQIPKQIRGK